MGLKILPMRVGGEKAEVFSRRKFPALWYLLSTITRPTFVYIVQYSASQNEPH